MAGKLWAAVLASKLCVAGKLWAAVPPDKLSVSVLASKLCSVGFTVLVDPTKVMIVLFVTPLAGRTAAAVLAARKAGSVLAAGKVAAVLAARKAVSVLAAEKAAAVLAARKAGSVLAAAVLTVLGSAVVWGASAVSSPDSRCLLTSSLNGTPENVCI